MLLGGWRPEVAIFFVFVVLPSLLLLLLAAPAERRNASSGFKTLGILVLLFYAQALLYFLALGPILGIGTYFLMVNVNLFVCLVTTPFLIRATSIVKALWIIACFALLIFPGGTWSFAWLGKFGKLLQ